MNEDNLFKKIVEILQYEFEIEPNRIKKESSFYYDLKLDSLDLVDFSLHFEKELNITIPAENLKNIRKIEDFIVMIKEIK